MTSGSRQVRERLGHPVIDADGHLVPFPPPMEDYVRQVAGSKWDVRFRDQAGRRMDPDVKAAMLRERLRYSGGHWWDRPTRNTLDRATAALPKLLYERLDDMGIDYTVLFSSATGLEVTHNGSQSPGPEGEHVWNRALTAYLADITNEYADRMTTVGYVSMSTPEGAIGDLEYSVNQLGRKAVVIGTELRPIPAVRARYPDFFEAHGGADDPLSKGSTVGLWLDTFGLDSEYDYDPFWARCVELKVPVMVHSSGQRFTSRSTSNYMYNHMGHFADAGEAVCKSLFLGGVTRRFPDLKFAFLEGGVGAACRLYCDLFSHWGKRNREAIHDFDPANLDRDLFVDLHARYGGKMVEGRLEDVLATSACTAPDPVDRPETLDEFAACGIEREEDIRDLFVPSFFFGCEADDPINAVAFDSRLLPLGSRIKAVLGSDIGHWDVPDMTTLIEEAYELVERGLLTPTDFRDLTFGNAIELFAGMNPDFFNGTRVEAEVARELTRTPA